MQRLSNLYESRGYAAREVRQAHRLFGRKFPGAHRARSMTVSAGICRSAGASSCLARPPANGLGIPMFMGEVH